MKGESLGLLQPQVPGTVGVHLTGPVGAGQGPAGHHLAGIDSALQVACTDHGGRDEVVVHVLVVALQGLNEVHLGCVQVIRGLPCNKGQHSSHRKPGLPPGNVDM